MATTGADDFTIRVMIGIFARPIAQFDGHLRKLGGTANQRGIGGIRCGIWPYTVQISRLTLRRLLV